jgi:hypothetical protein
MVSTWIPAPAIASPKPALKNDRRRIHRERLARTESQQTWTEFAASSGDLLNWKDNVLKKYYRGETLSSDLARATFLFPDKAITGP